MKPGWHLLEWTTLAVVLLALVGLVWTPYPANAQDFAEHRLQGPVPGHPLGVDGLGRDFLSVVWKGAGNTVWMALAAVAANVFCAGGLLVIARTFRGFGAWAIGLAISIWLALPVVLIGLLLRVFMEPSVWLLILAAALGNVPLSFRQLRVRWEELSTAAYVEASVVLGATTLHLLRFTIWPNFWPDLLAILKVVFALSVLELSGLAFLGLIGDPDTPELGTILRNNLGGDMYVDAGLVIWPGLALTGILLLVHLSNTRVRSAAERPAG